MHYKQLSGIQQMLIETRLSVENIAHRAGFNDRQLMTTAFKKTTGVTPSAWRATEKEGES